MCGKFWLQLEVKTTESRSKVTFIGSLQTVADQSERIADQSERIAYQSDRSRLSNEL